MHWKYYKLNASPCKQECCEYITKPYLGEARNETVQTQ